MKGSFAIAVIAVLILSFKVSFSQSVLNGSINGVAAGNSQFIYVPDWSLCAVVSGLWNSADVCDIGFPSYNSMTTVTPVSSPDGGTWVGIANGVSPVEDECVVGNMVDLTIGEEYALQFYGACFGTGPGNYANGDECDIEIIIGNDTSLITIPMTASTWFTYCIPFTAISADMTFSLHIISGEGYAGLDGFTIANATSSSANLLGNDTVLCTGEVLVLDLSSMSGTYLWQDNSTQPIFNVTSSGVYSVEVNTGCEVLRDTIEVGFSPAPIVDLGEDTLLCPGEFLTLEVSASNVTYLWQDNSTDPDFLVTDPGVYWVNVIADCGVIRDSIEVSYVPSLAFDLGNDTSLCAGSSLLMDVSYLSGTYLWQDNSTGSTYTITHQGTYWVEVTNNCETTSDEINVQFEPVPNINLGNDTTLCVNQSVVLSASTNNATYTWQDNSGASGYAVTQPGTYWVNVEVANCYARDTIEIDYYPEQKLNLGNDVVLCDSFETIPLSSNIAGTAYLWSTGSVDPTIDASPDNVYSLSMVGANNCVLRDSVSVTYSKFKVFIGDDYQYCLGQYHQLNAGNGFVSYLWNTGQTNPVIEVNETGEYVVEVVDTNLCVLRDTAVISFEGCALFVPNSFTPNGDEINDEFIPKGENIDEYELQVYNRFGERVFWSDDLSEGWDGTFKGRSSQQGVYVYLITYRDEVSRDEVALRGLVTLIH